MTPPCAGKWELFDSGEFESHEAAKAICATCPMIAGCRDQLREAMRLRAPGQPGPCGTWAGQLVGYTRADESARFAREDAAFTEQEARECHAAYRRGNRGPYVETGYLVHERRRKVTAKAARQEAA